jgi:hypothetical protein
MRPFVESVLNTGWFTVRCIFELDPDGPHESEPRCYEERITLWQAGGFDDAIALAEADAHDYAASVGSRYLGLAQCSKADRPEHGAELFSLMRDSGEDSESYLTRFFDTGAERQERID